MSDETPAPVPPAGPRHKVRPTERHAIPYSTPEQVAAFAVVWPDGFQPDRTADDYVAGFNALMTDIRKFSPPSSSWLVRELQGKLTALDQGGTRLVPVHPTDARRRWRFECQKKRSGRAVKVVTADGEVARGTELMIRDALGVLWSRNMLHFTACGMSAKRGSIRYRIRTQSEYDTIKAQFAVAEAAFEVRDKARREAEAAAREAEEAAQVQARAARIAAARTQDVPPSAWAALGDVTPGEILAFRALRGTPEFAALCDKAARQLATNEADEPGVPLAKARPAVAPGTVVTAVPIGTPAQPTHH